MFPLVLSVGSKPQSWGHEECSFISERTALRAVLLNCQQKSHLVFLSCVTFVMEEDGEWGGGGDKDD